MIKVTSNLKEVTSRILGRLQAINDPNGPTRDKMLRVMALDTVAAMKERIHEKGLNSNEQSLGEYTSKYLKLREKGKDKTGKRYNRGSNPKVIFSLTRLMENDFNIISGSGSGYNLGFKNPLNADKANWLQQNPKFGKVYKPTATEVEHMKAVAEQFITDLLNGENPR